MSAGRGPLRRIIDRPDALDLLQHQSLRFPERRVLLAQIVQAEVTQLLIVLGQQRSHFVEANARVLNLANQTAQVFDLRRPLQPELSELNESGRIRR